LNLSTLYNNQGTKFLFQLINVRWWVHFTSTLSDAIYHSQVDWGFRTEIWNLVWLNYWALCPVVGALCMWGLSHSIQLLEVLPY
jgi:hypothetical protein